MGHSLSSIPEDLHGESEQDMQSSISEGGVSVADSESLAESLQSSGSPGSNSSNSNSEVGVCNSSPTHSENDYLSNPSREAYPSVQRSGLALNSPTLRALSYSSKPQTQDTSPFNRSQDTSPFNRGPVLAHAAQLTIKVRWTRRVFEVLVDDLGSYEALRFHLEGLTGVPVRRQTLIMGGRQLPKGESGWETFKSSIRPGQTLMLLGSAAQLEDEDGDEAEGEEAEGEDDPAESAESKTEED